MSWLCYWGACRGAWVGGCAAGLRMWPFLELLLGGFEKIQTTLIVRFAIYLTNVDNADAKCHEIQFSNKCCFLLGFFSLLSVNMYSRNLVILLMFVCGAKAHLGLSLLLEEKRYYFQVILCLKERQEPHVKKVHS